MSEEHIGNLKKARAQLPPPTSEDNKARPVKAAKDAL